MSLYSDRRLSTSMKWLKCPRCGRYHFFYRSRSADYLCRVCGSYFNADFKTETVSLIVPVEKPETAVKIPPLAGPKKQKSKKR